MLGLRHIQQFFSDITLYNDGQNHTFYAILGQAEHKHFVGYAYCKFENFRENFIFTTVLKDIFAMLKIHDKGMIYLYRSMTV